MTHEQAIEAVKTADIHQDDWAIDIINQLENRFACGYLTATFDMLSEHIDSQTEEFRRKLLRTMNLAIWA